MRYSVVLPRIDASDPPDARGALEQALSQWESGEQLAAVESVRRACLAARAAGNSSRGESLERAVAALSRALEGERRSQKPAPRRRGASQAPPAQAPKRPSQAPPAQAPKRPSQRAPADAAQNVMTARPQAAAQRPRAAAQAIGAVVRPTPAATAPPRRKSSGKMAAAQPVRSPSAVTRAARPTAPAAPRVRNAVPHHDPEGSDLLVTVTSANGDPAEGALVSRRAGRVAIAPGRGPGGTVMVRPLAPGEVAPSGASVALLVALEPDGEPILSAR